MQRLESARTVAAAAGVELIEGPYDNTAWRERITSLGLEAEPEGGARCVVCFGMRLVRTALYAAEHGFPQFTTTLTISPHKDAARIHRLGQAAAADHGLQFLAEDFKKQGGFQRSVQLSKQMGLYRQTYCGCLFSKDSA